MVGCGVEVSAAGSSRVLEGRLLAEANPFEAVPLF